MVCIRYSSHSILQIVATYVNRAINSFPEIFFRCAFCLLAPPPVHPISWSVRSSYMSATRSGQCRRLRRTTSPEVEPRGKQPRGIVRLMNYERWHVQIIQPPLELSHLDWKELDRIWMGHLINKGSVDRGRPRDGSAGRSLLPVAPVVDPMLAQRLRRWTNIGSTSGTTCSATRPDGDRFCKVSSWHVWACFSKRIKAILEVQKDGQKNVQHKCAQHIIVFFFFCHNLVS